MRRPGRQGGGGAGARRAGSARGSSSPVDARSWSGRSESSWVGEGNRPSARPRTTTRSRSSPTPMLTEPTSTPSPMRPTRPRSASSSSSNVRANTSRPTDSSTASRQDSRSRARSTRSAAFCSATGQAARRRFAAEQRAQMAPGPVGPLAPRPRLLAGLRQVVDQVQDEAPQRPGPVGLVAQSLGPPRRSVRIGLGQRRFGVSLGGEGGQTTIPVTAPCHDTGVARQPFPARHRVPTVRRSASVPRPARRRRPRAGSRRREGPEGPSSVRPTTRAVSGMTAAPFRAMPAAASCSWANRA